jgi:heptosyltransferase III
MIQPRRALFIQLRRIGDILMCTPSIRAFKKAYPDCQLDFLTEIPDVLRGNPHLSEIISVDSSRDFAPVYQYKLIKKIRDNRYDLVVDFLANPRSAWYSYLSGAETRLSYGFGHRKWAYNLTPEKSAEPAYAATDRLKLLESINILSDETALDFIVGDSDRVEAAHILSDTDPEPIVTLSPISRREFNRWPLESYAQLGDLLISKLNVRLLILAGPGEEIFASGVADSMNYRATVPVIKRLGVLGAIFEKSTLHIGNDNGPKHIAAACGAPTITIYGPHSHISWTYPDYSRHLWVRPQEYCQDCLDGRHAVGPRCIDKIPVDAVYDKAAKLLALLSSKTTEHKL